MPTLPARLLNPEEEEFARKQSRLANLDAEFAERELERATLQADLAALEKVDSQVVGLWLANSAAELLHLGGHFL